MSAALWTREWRGAQRRWWLQPWAAAAGVCAAALLAVATPAAGEALRLPWRDAAALTVIVAQALLALWMVAAVARAVTRERRLGTHGEIAVTLVTSRELALAKTFAPAHVCILALTLLAVADAYLVWSTVTSAAPAASRVEAIPVLEATPYSPWSLLAMRLGHLMLGQHIDLERFLGAGPEVPPGRWLRLALWAELPARTLLAGAALATLTAWTACRLRSPLLAVMGVLAGLALLFAAAWGLDRVWYGCVIGRGPLDPIITASAGPPAGAGREIALELGYDWTMRFAAPLLWLVWWWRWTERRFLDVWKKT